MSLDTEMQAMVADLAGEFGKGVTIRRTVSSYDPGTGTETTTDYDVSATVAPPKDYTDARIQDTLIAQGDTVIDVPAQGLDMTSTGASGDEAPVTSDKVRIDGVTWQIVQVGRLWGGEQVAAYRLHIRK